MKKEKKKLSATQIITILISVPSLGLAVYIMANNLGLIDKLDFGAGAYYYADIPEFTRFVNGDHFTSQVPMWALIILFLIWGALMYRFWIWLEKKL